jgi:hypothetical protein
MSKAFSRGFTQMNADQIRVYPRESAAKLLLSRARTPAGDVDWEYLFQLARRHSIVPLVYAQLNVAPPEVLAKFKQHYIENSARNTVLTAELCRLINLFRDEGIEAIPFKGPVLALFAYGDVALRRFVDLDVIVEKSNVIKAREILLKEGYTPSKSLSLAQQELLLHTQHNLQFSRDNHQLIIELHWEIAPHLFASTLNGERLWQDLITLDLNGTPVKTFSAEDLLFSLCVHGSRHLWERLGWICDIAELLARHTFDWPTLLKRAADNERMFLLGLHLAERLLDAPLPDEIKQRCASDPRLESLANNIVDHLFNGTTHIPATSREIFKYNLGVRKTFSARARYLLYMLRPTDGDLASHSLPASLNFAYYLTRPFRLFRTKI